MCECVLARGLTELKKWFGVWGGASLPERGPEPGPVVELKDEIFKEVEERLNQGYGNLEAIANYLLPYSGREYKLDWDEIRKLIRKHAENNVEWLRCTDETTCDLLLEHGGWEFRLHQLYGTTATYYREVALYKLRLNREYIKYMRPIDVLENIGDIKK